MNIRFKGLFSLFAAFILISCSKPECRNTNSIFDNNAPSSMVYKRELASMLRAVDNSKLTYWFDQYSGAGGQDYIFVHVQGEGLCAVAQLSVREWKGLERIKNTAGRGYRGAELVDLRIKIEQQSDSTGLEYNGLSKIRD